LISLLAFFSGMVSSGDQLLLVYYLEEHLGFTDGDVSVVFLIYGVAGTLAQAILLKPLNESLGEKMVVALCFSVGAAVNTMYGTATNKATVYAAVVIAAFNGMAFPTISAIKSNNVVRSFSCFFFLGPLVSFFGRDDSARRGWGGAALKENKKSEF